LKEFEREFHSAGYHLMTEVVTALRTILNHLVKALHEQRIQFEDRALKFILNLHKHLTSDAEVLQEIGVSVEQITEPCLACLAKLPLAATYSCLRLFSCWEEEGFYDFSTFPHTFKTHLSVKERQSLEQIRSKWTGPLPDLMKELQRLINTLKKSEKDILSQVDNVSMILSLALRLLLLCMLSLETNT
jgi:hypothetical protein